MRSRAAYDSSGVLLFMLIAAFHIAIGQPLGGLMFASIGVAIASHVLRPRSRPVEMAISVMGWVAIAVAFIASAFWLVRILE